MTQVVSVRFRFLLGTRAHMLKRNLVVAPTLTLPRSREYAAGEGSEERWRELGSGRSSEARWWPPP